MNSNVKTTRVNLDGVHSLDVTVNEQAKTVVAELVIGNEATFIYAEKFDAPCNYLRTAIKKAILYLNGNVPKSESVSRKTQENNVFT
ncbi:MAG: hypothetical protein J6J45_04160 [Clostridia bacterium]|nr:hypothetical protein [Clostridia bacterium]